MIGYYTHGVLGFAEHNNNIVIGLARFTSLS